VKLRSAADVGGVCLGLPCADAKRIHPRRIDALGVRRVVAVGSALAIAACAAVPDAPTLAPFLAAHALVGLAFACLLSGDFAGVAAFPPERRSEALGYVAGANALAWIVVNPIVGAVTEWLSWRAAEVAPATVALAAARNTGSPPRRRTDPRQPHLTALLGERSARR
jgi:MFS family permease